MQQTARLVKPVSETLAFLSKSASSVRDVYSLFAPDDRRLHVVAAVVVVDELGPGLRLDRLVGVVDVASQLLRHHAVDWVEIITACLSVKQIHF